ncbi:MAG: hypothetical protein ACRYF7_05880 [Janthinobacterium lividum]
MAAFCTYDPVDMPRLFHKRIANNALKSGSAGDLQADGGPGTILADGVGGSDGTPPWWSTGVGAGRGRRWIRAVGFVVVVNKFVYKLVVIVNAHVAVDKKGFLHNVNGLRSR